MWNALPASQTFLKTIVFADSRVGLVIMMCEEEMVIYNDTLGVGDFSIIKCVTKTRIWTRMCYYIKNP